MKIRSLIIDDNPFIIDLLSEQLEQNHPHIEVVGTAKSGREGLAMIKAQKPELVFLDVELPDMTGFDMLAGLTEISFQTIFITSFSHYAIKAIRFNALDYLVKPIDERELAQALKRFQTAHHTFNRQQVQIALKNLQTEKPADQTLYLPTQDGGLNLALKNIIRIEGERNYSYIFLKNKTKKLSSKTLGYFEELLSDKGFFRCHRSHLVNGGHVKTFQKDGTLLLKNETLIPVSRRKKIEVKKWAQGFLGR
jgi:two-component system LytT family response regulator